MDCGPLKIAGWLKPEKAESAEFKKVKDQNKSETYGYAILEHDEAIFDFV